MYTSYNYSTSGANSAAAGAAAGIGIAYYIIMIAICVLEIIATWKIFTKAGEAGWKSIIPIYNIIVLFKIVGMNPWMILLLLVPIANIVVPILFNIKLAKAFGKGGGFAAGLIFLNTIFTLILGFGSAEYVGPQE